MTPSTRPLVVRDALIVDPSRGLEAIGTLVVKDGIVAAAGPDAQNQGTPAGAEVIDGAGLVVMPGAVDARVFTGEPGAEHRETLATAGAAAAAGGVTTMVLQPDTDPVIDDPALVDFLIRRGGDARVHVKPMAALSRGLRGEELTEFGLLSEAGAVAFTDGKKAVANANLLRRALTYARNFGALVVNHVEEPSLAGSGVMNAGEAASRLGLPGVPREAETIMLERDMRLVGLTKGRYHAALVSCADAVEVVRAAKARGLDVTCGVSINHVTLNENDIGSYRTFFRMSPPLRTEDDRQAVVAALADGTIDCLVSAHDPQDVEMKRHPFAEAGDGAVGLETLIPAALRLVHDGSLGWSRLVAALSTTPARRFKLPGGTLAPGASADVVLVDPQAPWVLDRMKLASRSKNTPFEDARFTGRVVRTLVKGETVHG